MSKREFKSHFTPGTVVRAARIIQRGYRAYNAVRKLKRKFAAPRVNIHIQRKRRRRDRRILDPDRLHKFRGRLSQRVVKKKLRSVCAFMKMQEAVHIHRIRGSTRILAVANQNGMAELVEGGNLTKHEAAMTNLKFFDPATNTMVTANPATGTYDRNIRFSVKRKIVLTNNYQVPCEVRVYKCRPKDATSNTPNTLYASGLVDQGNPSSVSTVIFPQDSKDLTGVWNLKVCYKRLNPGQSMTCIDIQPMFKYDFSLADAHPLLYNKKLGGFAWLIRVNGVLGHDTTLDEQGILPCGVDCLIDTTYTFNYDAGKDVRNYSIADTLDTFTNSGVISAKPIADNISYSVA